MVQLRKRKSRPIGFIDPCLPSPAREPPSGPDWIHEIKHDGFRVLARLDETGVRLLSRNGNDLARRFPFVTLAIGALPARSCLIDGEAIVCDEIGVAVFDLIRGHRTIATAIHCAFDLLELNGEDLRAKPIELRKRKPAKLLRRAHSSVALNQHYEGDGAAVYKHACALGCEGIVSKQLGSPYRSGRSEHWVKVKNPKAAAVRREAEAEWR